MKKTILDFPLQFNRGLKVAKNVFLKHYRVVSPPNNIIICGMGGSGLIGEILVNLRPLNIFINKSYGLPPQAGIGSIIICVSYSGNTEETLSSFKEAIKRKLPIIAITTGGELEKIAKKNNIPLAILPPPYIPPRLALGEQFSAISQILENHNLLSESFIKEILNLGEKLKSKKLEAQGKKLAKKIHHKIPIIYTTNNFKGVSLIWKNSLNETAKMLAIDNYFPELNHNEIVGFSSVDKDQINNKKLIVIILKDPDDHPRILKQIKITKDIIEKEGIKTEIINMQGKNKLEKIFSTIILGFWTSYWLAIYYKVDPTPVKTIENLKKRLKANI
ncbi:MAG: bifunctional phosphoglucose/phosphomannose isomerase [Candidatus Nealsonbacteria bacterium]